MLLPVILVHGNERKHIDRRLEETNIFAPAVPMKAVFGYSVRCVSLVCTLVAGAALVSVTRYSVGIIANKDSVVVLFRLINHPVLDKGIEHVAIKPALKHQVSEDSAHIAVGLWQHKRLLWFPFYRR